MFFIERFVIETSNRAWKLKGIVPFLIVESDWRGTNPPLTPTISPNISNQNFTIDILFHIVESSGKKFFEDDNPPQPSAQGL
jgi:hypothetical protein